MKSLLSPQEKRLVKIIGISLDTHEESKLIITATDKDEFPGAFDITLLSDTPHEVVDKYGIYNPAEESYKPGIPYPITYIIDKKGIVTHRLFDQVTYERPTNIQVKTALKEIGAL